MIPPSSLLNLIDDCEWFVLQFFDVMKESTMHIYHSALPWSPTSSLTRKLYQRLIESEVTGERGRCELGRLFKINSIHQFCSESFSHTGSSLAVGSRYSVQIFETATGVATFEDGEYARCIAFSPDDEMVACGYEGRFGMWNQVVPSNRS
jgi:hypothetical protein